MDESECDEYQAFVIDEEIVDFKERSVVLRTLWFFAESVYELIGGELADDCVHHFLVIHVQVSIFVRVFQIEQRLASHQVLIERNLLYVYLILIWNFCLTISHSKLIYYLIIIILEWLQCINGNITTLQILFLNIIILI
jgi:hypothetical protein